jgi:hypothetical protein
MEIEIVDRFTDNDFEWEVVAHPQPFTAARPCARGSRPGLPETERDMT